MKIYIGKNKFHFITDYSKYTAKNTSGEDIVIDFGLLTIEQRIMLSAYLTLLCNDKNLKKENIYEIIFNFNSKKIYKKPSYQNIFLQDLTKFLKNKSYFFSFIKDNFNKIENDKTFIYRQQLNSSQMEVLYSLKFQRSYSSLMNVLYIIGVAKQNIVTTALNHISLDRIYRTSSFLAKKRINEIFDKLNKVSKNKIEYIIKDKEVWFKNGFSVDENEEFNSQEKKQFDKNKKMEEWLKSSILK